MLDFNISTINDRPSKLMYSYFQTLLDDNSLLLANGSEAHKRKKKNINWKKFEQYISQNFYDKSTETMIKVKEKFQKLALKFSDFNLKEYSLELSFELIVIFLFGKNDFDNCAELLENLHIYWDILREKSTQYIPSQEKETEEKF